MLIRQAREKDIPEITALGDRFTVEIPAWGQLARTKEQVSQLDIRLIWVAEEKDKIIGYAVWAPHDKGGACIFNENDKVLALDEIYLIPEARGQGLGGELIDAVNTYAKKEGYTKLFMYSSVKDIMPIIRFYKGSGFKTWNVQFFKEVK